MSVRAMIVRAAGTNCDEESRHAFELAGASADLVHVRKWSENPNLSDEYDILMFPGGFTFGDDVASGAVMAHTIRERLADATRSFVDRGRFVLGICNGFQVLVRLGILPGGIGRASLSVNRSGRYEDRWIRLRAEEGASPWFTPGREYVVPIAHAEGRFVWFPDEEGAAFPEAQVSTRYVENGDLANGRYPANPNGSDFDIAGVTNPDGNVMGMMPHPERFVQPTHYPDWTRFRSEDGSPPTKDDLPVPLGLELFENIVRAAKSG